MGASQSDQSPANRRLEVCLLCGCFLLFLSNVALFRAYHRLAKDRDAFKAKLELGAGVSLPPLTAKTASGQDISVKFDQKTRHTLFFVYSPACVFCEETWAKMGGDDSRA